MKAVFGDVQELSVQRQGGQLVSRRERIRCMPSEIGQVFIAPHFLAIRNRVE